MQEKEVMLKNIVIINDFNYVQGGGSKVAIDTANLLAELSDYRVYFFSQTSSKSELNEKVNNITIDVWESITDPNRMRGLVNNLYNIRVKQDLRKFLRQLNKEETVIHIHGWTKVLSASVFSACFHSGIKTVLTGHDYFTVCPNGGFFNFRSMEKCGCSPMSFHCLRCNCDSRNYGYKIYRCIRIFIQNTVIGLPKRLSNIIYISALSRKILEPYFNRNIKAFYVYNPVEGICNAVQQNSGNYYLFVGRVCTEKGTDLFCKVVSSMGLPGTVVGDGPLLATLKDQYPSIEFAGWRDKKKVHSYMRNAKALIFTSVWYETMGLTVVEAQLNGIPVFVRADTAAVEFSEYPELIFRDEQDLREKIRYFEKSELPHRETDGRKYSPESYVKRLIEVYNSLQ